MEHAHPAGFARPRDAVGGRLMHRFGHVAAALIAVAGWAALSGSAGAEGFIDVRVGGAFTDNAKVSGGGMIFGSGTTQFDDSVTGGLRGGYWFERLRWLGLAGQVGGLGRLRHVQSDEIRLLENG